MKLRSILLLGASILMFCDSIAQMSTFEQKGNKFYKVFTYDKAINKYEKVGLDNLTTEGLRNLAEAHRLTHNTEKSEVYYKALSTKSDNKAEDLLRYSEMLQMNGKDVESRTWLDKFHSRLSSDGRGTEYSSRKGSYKELMLDKGQFKIFNLEINTSQQDFGPAFYMDQVVFASARKNNNPIKRKWNWNNEPYLNLYTADIAPTKQLMEVDKQTKKINKKYHEGPASYSKDGNLMVFTRNNYDNKSEDGERKLTMHYREKNEKGKWGDIVDFEFNNKEYSVGHPAVTADGQTIYFASNMPGSKGGTDLYVIEKASEGWTSPKSLGNKINTEGNEMFPFVHESGLLFFASNGHVGLGGLDVFAGKLTNGSVGNIQNVGYPINTPKDDFGFILDDNQKYGYFSSNRSGGKGSDDIYGYNLLKPFNFCKEIKGLALDKKGDMIPGANVTLVNKGTKEEETVTTDENGAYSFCVKPGNYELKGTKEKYFSGENKATTTEENSDPVKANVILEKDPGFSLLVNVKDAKDKNNLDAVNVTFNNQLDKQTNNSTTDPSGNAGEPLKGVRLNDGISYMVTLEKAGYLPKTVPFTQKLTQPGVQKLDVELEKIPDFSLYTLVADKKTGKPLDGVTVTLVNNSDNSREVIKLPATGDFTRGIMNKKLNDNISYRFVIEREGYLKKELTYNNKLVKEGRYDAHTALDFSLDPIEVGGDLSKLIEINPIYFNFNKHFIRKDAALELDKIVAVMNEYPSMHIELGSHTDCRGSKRYNEKLSDRRAKSSAAYIASRITNPKRISGKGYGENKILNGCECEGKIRVKCSEKEHDSNRRTEFKITKFNAKNVKVKVNGPQSFDK